MATSYLAAVNSTVLAMFGATSSVGLIIIRVAKVHNQVGAVVGDGRVVLGCSEEHTSNRFRRH